MRMIVCDYIISQLSCSCNPSKAPQRDDKQEQEACVSRANAKEPGADVDVAVHEMEPE